MSAGWWTGSDAKCGYDDNNPVKVAYSTACRNMWQGACDNYGRDSWDPNTVYVSIMGASGGGQCNIGSGRACAYSVSDDGKTEYRNYNDHSKNMYDFSLVGDISSVGNTIEQLLCQAPKLGRRDWSPAASVVEQGAHTTVFKYNSSKTSVEESKISEEEAATSVIARKGPHFG